MTTQKLEKGNRKSQYARLFLIIAVGLIIAGGIHLYSALTTEPTTVNIADSIYHPVMAVAFYACSKLVKVGKRQVIYLLVFIGIITIFYGLLMGRGFNFFNLAISAYFIWQMFNLSRDGELT
ncbi:MAG: hypothetical protein ACE5E7_06940 [Anaerolineae bacterium]